MKNNVFTLGLIAVAALTLATNCVKNEADLQIKEETPSVQETFELSATSSDDPIAKTSNNGLSTKWAASDKLTVFHAETATSSYVKDGQFSTTSEDKDAGLFKGTLASELEGGKSYDWYVIYPNKDAITTPANTTVLYNVGGRNDQPAVQTNNNSKAHLAGSYFPLFGKATAVGYDEKPAVAMNQLSSVVEVTVTNNSTAPITVENVTFTAPTGEAIVGQFVLDFTASPITYTNSVNVSETAVLKVNEGASIPVDGSASFYLGIKPFTAAAGKTLKVSVNGHEKTLTLGSAAEFKPGKIKTLNFNYNFAPDVYELVTSLGAFSDGGKYVFALQDGVTTSTYYFLNNAGANNTLDTDLTVSASSITNPTSKYVFTAEAASTLFKFVNAEGGYIYNSGSNTTLNTNGDEASWLVTALDGGYFKFNLSNSDGRFIGANAATPSKAMGYTNGSFKNQHAGTPSAIAQYSGAWSVFKLGGYVAPTGIDDATVDGEPARGGSGRTKSVVLNNYASAPTLTANPDGVVVTSAIVSATTTTSATITYTLAPNYSHSTRAGSITVTDTDSHSATITVNQIADKWETNSANPLIIGSALGATKSCTIYSDFDWTINTANLSGATVSPDSFTYSDAQNQSITFTTTAANESTSPASLGYITVIRTADGSTLTINLQQSGVAVGVELPFDWDNGKSGNDNPNLTFNSGSDYSSSPKVKLDAVGKYMQIRTSSAAGTISFLAKQNGTSNDGVVTLKGSDDGSSFSDIESFSINQGNTKTKTCSSSVTIASTYRYFRIELTTKGTSTNVGIGSIHIE